MKERNGLKVMLGIVGLLAWMAYILACRPSWSPDGSKVLFPYYNPEADEAGVALYDRNTGETRSIFVQSRRSGDRLIPVQWESDGARAIIWAGGRQLLLLPIDSGKPARRFRLPEDIEWQGRPYPEVGGNLYLGDKTLTRLNLETGEVKSRELEVDDDVVLFQGNNSVFYAKQVDTPEDESEEGEGSGDGGIEIGELDLDGLTFQPLFELKERDLAAHGVKEVLVFMDLEPSGSRIAMIGQGEDRDFIILCTRAGLQKVVAPEFPVEQYRLGNLQWAPDGKTIYAVVLTPTGKKYETQYSLGEIPVDGGSARLLPVTLIQDDFPGKDYDLIVTLQIALSPDGATIATTTGHLNSSSSEASAYFHRNYRDLYLEDRALYLVDVQDPGRKVTKVPLPPLQKAGASDEEE